MMNAPHPYEEYVLREYDLVPRTIIPLPGKNVWKVVTPFGHFLLKKSHASSEQLQFVAEHLQVLARKGFSAALPFVPTKYGEAFVSSESGLYYLVPWVEGPLSRDWQENESLDWHEKVLEKMAQMHYLTLRFWSRNHKFHQWNRVTGQKLIRRWEKRLDMVKKYNEEVKKSAYPSPFETAFKANASSIVEMGKTAIAQLREWLDRKKQFRHVFCHGRLHRENILFNQRGQVVFIDFDHANLDTPVRDLALFFRRHMNRFDWHFEVGDDWMEIYQTIFPLTEQERRLMSVYLLYPERIMKLIQQYQNRDRDSSEIFFVRQFEKQVNQCLLIRQFAYHFIRHYT
ncbi:MAG: phosphotransferase [Bacillaceae bacterium]|nr:phosphotransferase [Bacillaceae bacterium]